MTSLAFAFRYALRSLRRSGQRGALAVVCVAFGVFSLVGLQLLAAGISDALLLPPTQALGGDLALGRDGAPLSDADLAAIAADPDVTATDARGSVPARFIQTADNARMTIFIRALAVDPATYPLLGDPPRLTEGALAEALADDGSAVLSIDLANALGATVGDRVRLAGTPGDSTRALTVAGIAERLPDAIGGTVLVSHATAAALAGGPTVSRVFVRTDDPDAVQARFEAAGWGVLAPQLTPDLTQKIFELGLPGVGLLGLLLGGIGVANTLQVVLTRRRPEVAVLKTLGYRQRDLMWLFGVETAILGGIGGVLGGALGVLGAEGLRWTMTRGIPLLIDVPFRPGVLAGGLVAGVATAVLFGLIAIVRASAVRPGVLLRQTPVPMSRRTRAVTVGLSLLLFALFGVLGSALIGSLAVGFGAIAAGVLGLVVFGALMVATLWVVVRIPTPGLPLVRMAAANLGRHPARAASSLVALFVGTFVIALSGIVILNGQEQVAARMVDVGQTNATLYGIPADDPALVRIADAHGAMVWTDRTVDAEITWPDGEPLPLVDALHGRPAEGASTVAVSDSALGGPWLADPGGVLVPEFLAEHDKRPVAVGDTVVVRVGEAEARLAVAGTYGRFDGVLLIRTSGLIVLPAAFDRIVEGATVTSTVAAEVPADRLEAFADGVGAARSEGAVIIADDVVGVFIGLVRGLFYITLSLTSLALLAGMVLIANGVGLALVERRREFGVLKAVGYSAGQVLRMLLVENAVLGLVGGGLGVGAAAATLFAIRETSGEFPITIYPGVSLALVGVAILLAVASALAVAAGPVRQRPLDVLRAD